VIERGVEMGVERTETMVIGGGQAGLAVGFYLSRAGRPFVIVDAHERVGDAWRNRWDSLRLFTPAHFNGLPGMRFPASPGVMPTKDEMADYLEAYARRFALPVREGVRVDRLERVGDRYLVAAGERTFEAENVVIATGAHSSPRIPAFSKELRPEIGQLHSGDYRRPSQLRDGGVLVVGAGNSGAEIAFEVVRGHPCWLSGRDPGHVPVNIDRFVARNILARLRFSIGAHVLTLRTPMGRRMAQRVQTRGIPVVRVKPKWLLAAGVERVPRTVGTRDGLPLLKDGRFLEVANVIWCTGSGQDLSWVRLPIFQEDGRPRHDRGVVLDEPGLYFIGLTFQFAVVSDILAGLARDARYVAKRLLERADNRQRTRAAA
jgi:putative flavoprotein involved in K+ transport